MDSEHINTQLYMAKIIDQVFDYLKAQGLQPEKRDYGLFFKYQMMSFLVLHYEDDEYFFRIIMPGVMDVDANNRIDVLEACNKVTADIKVAKAFINDSADEPEVWLSTEQLLDQDPRFDDVIPRSLKILLAAHSEFSKAINE